MTKLYYKIGEVCEITGLRPSVLRFWEKEFKQLRPSKSGGGQRFYTEKHIELIRMLMKMLYEEKYTIEGAKKRLKDISGDDDSSAKSANEEIRAELIDILKILNS
ncbi:MerR family transcriptional regulator [Seleniivibrio woodruffii]|uniref:DNA-binding transcriptional MerR regulator n=1 Tax=Seleniivibrio woodruffii TaxID=1078050 RepID=A0A4R1K9B6_9BACT|nr:MerR family transcriptional regulator [Seleniivibrio woodruffii]TCK60620.1 DNA-binding transcriptional MerR regulator [Seleniivibrio woodruffii]TVZ36249.1 DNA-binding transcriptional MerR regulator [Seleniivibrio woodruffii]